MKTSGSGWKRGDQRRVTLNFVGTDEEFIDLIDALELMALDLDEDRAEVLREIMRQVNYHSGTLVNHPAPSGGL